MRLTKMFFVISVLIFVIPSTAVTGDFDWMPDFNIRAEADLSGFRARLTARFKIGEAQINTVLSHVEKPADAYMILRLGEMSKQTTDHVVKEYKSHKGKGWGALAKSLGIKPGSKEFHALKQGSDLYDNSEKGKDKGTGKGKGKN